MKRTQKLLTWILVVLVAFSILLVACDDKPQVKNLDGLEIPKLNKNQMAVIVKNSSESYTCVTVTISDEFSNVEDVLDFLDKQGTLSVKWEEGSFGKFIVGIGNLQPDKTKQYITVLTSVEQDQGNWAGVTTYTVNETTLRSSQVGVSSMHVEGGAVVYFEVEDIVY